MAHYRSADGSEAQDFVHLGRSRTPSSLLDDDVDRIEPVVEDGLRDHQLEEPNADEPDSSSAEQRLVSKSAQDAKTAKDSADFPLLRYRRTSVWLLVCYLPFLILPWILTNIMVDRPPSLPSYYNQQGQYCEKEILAMLFWLAFVRVLNSIASVLVIPITSALLAQGAVVYTQRRRVKQKLNLRQTFALSDRGWGDITILWGAYCQDKGTASRYLKYAACLLILSAIQAPVRDGMVGYEVIIIMTCADFPPNMPVLGYDPEPYDLALTPQNVVVPDVIKSLATVTNFEMQPYLWHDTATDGSVVRGPWVDKAIGSTFWVPYHYDQNMRYFVSAFPNTTTTGVYRQHIMRLNSSAECNVIDATAFPQTCDGPDPLVATYVSQTKAHKDFDGFGNLEINVCVPGNQSESPWTLSRDRQDIAEDLYIKVHSIYGTFEIGAIPLENGPPVNFTLHCTGNTTRGYFELPNFRNNFNIGPLLEKWPDNETLGNEYNDYLTDGLGLITGIPSTVDERYGPFPDNDANWNFPIDPFDDFNRRTPGPLMTSALAMFGKDSFFYVASNSSAMSYPSAVQQICQAGNIPFVRLDGVFRTQLYDQLFAACFDINDPYSEEHPDLDSLLYQWATTFLPQAPQISTGALGNHTYGTEALEVAMFFANQHWLLETAAATGLLYSARNIWTSPGTIMLRPTIPLYAKITVSIFIALQLYGLGVLVKYIYSVPTWTEKLDSCAIAQLTHDVDAGIFSTIKKPNEKALKELRNYDGLVGVAETSIMDDAASPSERNQKAAPNVGTIDSASSQSNESHMHDEPLSTENNDDVRLVKGGPGLVTRQYASFKEWKPTWLRLRRRKATKESILEKGDD